MENITHTNTASALHLSSLTQYCIPFGNFIFPIILWASLKHKSAFVDEQGKKVINFQLSLFIYGLVLALIAIPSILVIIFAHHDISSLNNIELGESTFNFAEVSGGLIIAIIAGLLICIMKVAEFFLIIYGAVKTSNGQPFSYPFTISFLK